MERQCASLGGVGELVEVTVDDRTPHRPLDVGDLELARGLRPKARRAGHLQAEQLDSRRQQGDDDDDVAQAVAVDER